MVGVQSAVELTVNKTAVHAQAQASNRMAKANKSWSKSEEGKGNSKENKGTSKRNQQFRTKVSKAHTRAKHRKLVSQVLKL